MQNVILRAITGSRAYGLNHADSGTDRMGIFVAPTLDVAGLNWSQHRETWSNASPDGDDTTYHEIGKYLRLVLKGNPTLIELLFMNEYEILDETGMDILSLRESIVSETNIRPSYYGYAAAQLREFQNRPNPKDKMPRHCLRIARQAVELLETGTTNVRVSDPEEYFDLTELPKYRIVEILGEEVEKIKTVHTSLRHEPDRERVVEFLDAVRFLNTKNPYALTV
jgi:hypothetical protein